MATALSTIITNGRVDLKETTARFWADAELVEHLKLGINDLWGAVVDLNQEHYLTIDTTNVTLAADTATLTGVPVDTFRVELIEPSDTTSAGTAPDMLFMPRDYKSADFRNARQLTSQDPTQGLNIFYALSQKGSPVAAPTVHVAPTISRAVALRFVYTPGPGTATMTSASTNPIPGESDNALKAWMVAFARAKEREDRTPDPNWLAIYATEKASILTRLTPRQTQEPDVVEDVFMGYL